MRALLTLLATSAAIALTAAPASASVEVPFTPRFSANARGDVTIAADTLMTCPDNGGAETACLQARDGTSGPSLNNNGYKMGTVDVDGDAATFDSSQATLSLPPGATVLFAGLFFGARTTAGEEGAAAPVSAARGTVLLRAPGSPAYATLAAEVRDSTGIKGSYVGFADVTQIVAAAGAGAYGVADVQAGTGKDRYAGWSLLVAYEDPGSPPRSLRVYDGLATISQGEEPLQIGIGGLETPSAGSVSAGAGLVGYEGDRGSTGDRLSLAGTPLFDTANPEKNIFNSSISVAGIDSTAKNPNYVNQLGFDADLLDADGILANGATSATLEESTSNEQYLTQAVSVAIELDPEVLEPPAPPPPQPPAPQPPTPTPPAAETPSQGGDKGGSEKKHDGGGAEVGLEVDANPAEARPSGVIGIRVTVDSEGDAALRQVEVCNALPAGLDRLQAPGSEGDAHACWHLAKLAPEKSHSFVTTAQVDDSASGTLRSRTVVTAGNAKTRRAVVRVKVTPLPDLPCFHVAAFARGAQASC